jgi:hypothetical protein
MIRVRVFDVSDNEDRDALEEILNDSSMVEGLKNPRYTITSMKEEWFPVESQGPLGDGFGSSRGPAGTMMVYLRYRDYRLSDRTPGSPKIPVVTPDDLMKKKDST